MTVSLWRTASAINESSAAPESNWTFQQFDTNPNGQGLSETTMEVMSISMNNQLFAKSRSTVWRMPPLR